MTINDKPALIDLFVNVQCKQIKTSDSCCFNLS